jgi:hypothetical protein
MTCMQRFVLIYGSSGTVQPHVKSWYMRAILHVVGPVTLAVQRGSLGGDVKIPESSTSARYLTARSAAAALHIFDDDVAQTMIAS